MVAEGKSSAYPVSGFSLFSASISYLTI